VVRLIVPEYGHNRIDIAEHQLTILLVTQRLIRFVLLTAWPSLATAAAAAARRATAAARSRRFLRTSDARARRIGQVHPSVGRCHRCAGGFR
jgi:hypothetical protein